jgi:hypothetical protein
MDNTLHLRTILRTIKTMRITLEAMQESLEAMIEPDGMPGRFKNKLHQAITQYDLSGVNMTKANLKAKANLPEFDQEFEKLLFQGDIYEISGIVYPLDSKNVWRRKI